MNGRKSKERARAQATKVQPDIVLRAPSRRKTVRAKARGKMREYKVLWNPTQRPPKMVKQERRKANKRARQSRKANRA